MRSRCCFLAFCGLSLLGLSLDALGAPKLPSRSDPELKRMIEVDDRLGARIRVKELSSNGLDYLSFKWIESQVLKHPEWGEDLLAFNLENVASSISGLEAGFAQQELEQADSEMLNKRFSEAAQRYRGVLQSKALKDSGSNTVNYVRMAYARALYSQGKFEESYLEARKITAQFARYRHVLFFRMWAAFRAGRIEIALGEVANQRSLFFAPYMEPESYLLLTYLLKRLCRESEVSDVMKNAELFLESLKSGDFGFKDWAKMEVGSAIYLSLLESSDRPEFESKRNSRKVKERESISKLLQASFQRKKKQWIEELPRVIAYSRLATTPGAGAALKPIEKIQGREKLLSQGYEIWPVQDDEHWLDELGSQRYLGDTQCASR